jgi:hypothetical protein
MPDSRHGRQIAGRRGIREGFRANLKNTLDAQIEPKIGTCPNEKSTISAH